MTNQEKLRTLFTCSLITLTALSAQSQLIGVHKSLANNGVAVASDDAKSRTDHRMQSRKRISDLEPGDVSFLPAAIYGSGGCSASSVAAADVNGDGKVDIVVANLASTSDGCFNGLENGVASVLLGNGDGTFQPAVGYSTGGVFAQSVAVADVNGDGKEDLLATNLLSSTVAVLLGNGDGTFQPAVTYASGGVDSWSVAVADVNADGKPDLLVANMCNAEQCTRGVVGVLLGNGDGTFQPAVAYGLFNTQSVSTADVNGDGKLDILVGSGFNTVGVLLGNGDGTFQSIVNYASGGAFATSAEAADVNRDGKLDLVVANCAPTGASGCGGGMGNAAVGVLLGNGDGTFQPVVSYDPGGEDSSSAMVADVNADGKLDLIVTNFCDVTGDCAVGTVSVLVGNGDGSFRSAVAYNSGSLTGGASWGAVADLNKDGKPDLVVANGCAENTCAGSVGVLLNNTSVGKFATSTSLASSLNPSIYGQKVTWTATVSSFGSVTPTGTVSFMWSGYTIGSATLNTVGVATLTRSNLNADPYPLVAVYKGDAANLGSTSPILNQTVQQTTSAASLTSSPNPSKPGQAVTFTTTITSPTVVPTGPVTFTAGTTTLGTAQLNAGKAKFTTSTLAVGSTLVTATYYGDSNITKSSASITQKVQK